MKITKCTKRIVGDVDKQYPEKIFNELLAFQGYGFNECLDINSTVQKQDGTKVCLKDIKIGDVIKSANKNFSHIYNQKNNILQSDNKDIIYVRVKNIFHNKKYLYKIHTNMRKEVISSLQHKFKVMRYCDGLNNYYMKPLCDILDSIEPNNFSYTEQKYHLITQDGIQEIISYDPCGLKDTIDLQVDDENHQFFANGILVSNSHSVAYSLYSAIDLFFKAHYPLEFICCYMNQCSRTDEIEGINAIKYLINYARKKGINVFKPDINLSQNKWIIHNNGLCQGLLFPLRDMMLLNNADIISIINNRPYHNFEDFYNKIGKIMNDKKLQHLICSDAFHEFGDIDIILTEYNSLKNNSSSDQLDLFAQFDDIVSDVPILSKSQQKKYQQEMLNFVFEKWLVDQYRKYIVDYNKKAKQNGFTRLKTLQEIQESEVKFTLIFAKVQKSVKFVAKTNKTNKVWVYITDGLYNGKIMMSQDDFNGSYKNYFQIGNVLQIPVMVSEQDRSVFFLNKNSQKSEIKIIGQK